MKRNRRSIYTASFILSMIMALSAPFTAVGAGVSDTSFESESAEEDSFQSGFENDSDESYFEEENSDSDFFPEDNGGESFPEDGFIDPEPEVRYFTVIYDMNGHGKSEKEEVAEGDYPMGVEPPEEDDYEFLGWFEDKGCSSPYMYGPVTSDIRIYAGWQKIETEPEYEEPEPVEFTDGNDFTGDTENESLAPEAGWTQENTDSEEDISDDNSIEETVDEETTDTGDTGESESMESDDGETADEETVDTGDTGEAESMEPDDGETADEETTDSGDTGEAESVESGEGETSETADAARQNAEELDDGGTPAKAAPNKTTEEESGNSGTKNNVGEVSEEGPDEESTGENSPGSGDNSEEGTDDEIGKQEEKEENSAEAATKKDDKAVAEPDPAVPDLADKTKWKIEVSPAEVNYPANASDNDETEGVSLTVVPPENEGDLTCEYQWFAQDKQSKKNYRLEGTTAQDETLYIPSITKEETGREYYCKVVYKYITAEQKETGKTITLDPVSVKVANAKKDRAVLYVRDYAIVPGESINLSQKPGLGKGIIRFDEKGDKIVFDNVQMTVKDEVSLDSRLAPSVGILLTCDGNNKGEYRIQVKGSCLIQVEDETGSVTDPRESALRFRFKDAKKEPAIVFEGGGSLDIIGAQTAILSDADLDIHASVTVKPKKGDTETSGIECKNLTVKKPGDLKVNAYGNAVYAHDTVSIANGAKADLFSIPYRESVKDAALYCGKDLKVSGGNLTVRLKGDESDVRVFNGIETSGKIEISDEATVQSFVSFPGFTCSIKSGGAFAVTDSNVTAEVTAPSSGETDSSSCGILCGSAAVSLSKENTYVVRAQAAGGIGFAALTGKTGTKKQEYKEGYTAQKIKMITTDIFTPLQYAISTGSIRGEKSGYLYAETVYDKKDTAKPASLVIFDSNKHVWGDAAYNWVMGADGKTVTVTAKRTCKNHPSAEETETVGTTSRQTKAPTCTEWGHTAYTTAAFKNKAFTTQTKSAANIKPLGHKYGDWVVTKKPTLTETGIRKARCERKIIEDGKEKKCGHIKSEEIPKLEKGTYKVTKGASLTWSKGSKDSLKIKVERTTHKDTAFSHFQGILVDGKLLNKQYYSAKSGSVVITFKPDFLSRLAVGSHTLTYGFEDGDNPTSKLNIQNAAANNGRQVSGSSRGTSSANGAKGSVSTGDNTNIILWVVLLGASALAIILVLLSRKMKKAVEEQNKNGSDAKDSDDSNDSNDIGDSEESTEDK